VLKHWPAQCTPMPPRKKKHISLIFSLCRFVSWNTAVYFRADKAPFGKAMTQLLEYERIHSLRIVGDRYVSITLRVNSLILLFIDSVDNRLTLEFEMLPKQMAHKRLSTKKEAAADDDNEQRDDDAPVYERFCFTVSVV
jgi:hypothetical protein